MRLHVEVILLLFGRYLLLVNCVETVGVFTVCYLIYLDLKRMAKMVYVLYTYIKKKQQQWQQQQQHHKNTK